MPKIVYMLTSFFFSKNVSINYFFISNKYHLFRRHNTTTIVAFPRLTIAKKVLYYLYDTRLTITAITKLASFY
jgi:hypothetical protein